MNELLAVTNLESEVIEAIKSTLLGMAILLGSIAAAILFLWAVIAWAKADFPIPAWSVLLMLISFAFASWSIGSSARQSMRDESANQPSDG